MQGQHAACLTSPCLFWLLQIAAVIAIFMPLWESRDVFARVVGRQSTLPRDAKLPETLGSSEKPGQSQYM